MKFLYVKRKTAMANIPLAIELGEEAASKKNEYLKRKVQELTKYIGKELAEVYVTYRYSDAETKAVKRLAFTNLLAQYVRFGTYENVQFAMFAQFLYIDEMSERAPITLENLFASF